MPSRKERETTPARGPGGRGAGLGPAQIVEAAIRVIDRSGVSALSMRAVGDELGVHAQALYWHFKNKDELCAAIVEELSSDLDVNEADIHGSPREQLERHLHLIRDHWRRHPAALELGSTYVPTVMGATSRRGYELIGAMGIAPDRTIDVHRSLMWAVIGIFQIELSIRSSAHHRPVVGRDDVYEVTLPFADGRPTMELNTTTVFDDSIRLLLDGIEAEAQRSKPRA